MNILVVDDDKVDREAIKRMLKGADAHYTVKESVSVDEALSYCIQEHFDVILLDYNLPLRKGIELIYELEEKKIDHENVIIIMSNSEDEQLALDCIEAGAQDFLLKKEISPIKLRRAIFQAKKRFEMKQQLCETFYRAKVLAERDPLTSLPNRYLFNRSFKALVNDAENLPGYLALVLFDVDDFKLINDSYGHSVGDQLLLDVCHRINLSLLNNELFARLGGDEFALVLVNLPYIKQAKELIDKISKSLEEPFIVEGHRIYITISAGISIFDKELNSTLDEMLKHADLAMYRSKSKGKGLVSYFEQHFQEQVDRRVEIETSFSQAIKSNNLFLLYQPIVNADSHQVYGCETLLRWCHDKIALSPDEFIPMIEESHQIINVGKWVINEALSQLSIWRKNHDCDLIFSINLSPVQLSDPQLVEYIQAQCELYGIPPQQLQFELTETAFIGNIEQQAEIIKKMDDLGFAIALDDFGTGFSSISHLQALPIRTVKIDKSIIPKFEGKEYDCDSYKLIRGLAKMINIIGINSVAEGIENKEMEQFCIDIGIQNLQGYYYSVPLKADQFQEFYLK